MVYDDSLIYTSFRLLYGNLPNIDISRDDANKTPIYDIYEFKVTDTDETLETARKYLEGRGREEPNRIFRMLRLERVLNTDRRGRVTETEVLSLN